MATGKFEERRRVGLSIPILPVIASSAIGIPRPVDGGCVVRQIFRWVVFTAVRDGAERESLCIRAGRRRLVTPRNRARFIITTFFSPPPATNSGRRTASVGFFASLNWYGGHYKPTTGERTTSFVRIAESAVNRLTANCSFPTFRVSTDDDTTFIPKTANEE